MSFRIEKFNGQNFPSFNRPEIAGYFSLNGQNRQYSQDLSQLKYYNDKHEKKVYFNLNKGFERVIRKPPDLDERIDHILKWIIDNHRQLAARPEQKRWLKPDFVSFRGLLTRICCTPYEDREDWIICAAKFRGTIYLCAFDTEDRKYRNANMSRRDLQFTSWGFKFEQYVLSESPDSHPKTLEPVNEAEEFCCLFSTKLGQNALLYGAEMDGVCSETVLEEPVDWKTIKFIELKTNREIETDRQYKNYQKKLLKWWSQSFIVGIENVICGKRTDNGVVFELEDMKVSDMPKICKGLWNASHCMNVGNDFLNHLKTVVTREHNECIYKFEYKLSKNITMQELPSSSEFAFLPDWFIQQANQINKNKVTENIAF